ncbi:hypothetical protein [Pseudokineococcus sp. 1T1Z-3]|uniref:hypothetical protein n=1 Tax=Pseudokineococcus sp. 1T1Z-3 TaxID=3132745 RepID=UPI0030B45AD2
MASIALTVLFIALFVAGVALAVRDIRSDGYRAERADVPGPYYARRAAAAHAPVDRLVAGPDPR